MKHTVPRDKNCGLGTIDGFLKNVCFNETSKQYYHVCVNSSGSYQPGSTVKYENAPRSYYDKFSIVSDRCENDPSVYQACGFSTKITRNHKYLCGGYFIDDAEQKVKRFVDCGPDCAVRKNKSSEKEATISGLTSGDTTVCDDKCDDKKYCKDESVCNGFRYGWFCKYPRYSYSGYIPVAGICYYKLNCFSSDDEENCSITENTTAQTCIRFLSKMQVDWSSHWTIPILNYTRCSVFDLDSEYTFPYCYDYMDQTNCTDPERVGGHCYINGYKSNVSKYILCDSPLMIMHPAQLCDDKLENECISPPGSIESCLVHKHKLCDGVFDCDDHSDEENDVCKLAIPGYFKCNRTFNVDKNVEIPISWILDNQTDCVDGADEVKFGLCSKNNSAVSTVSHYVFCGNLSIGEPASMCKDGPDDGCFHIYIVNTSTNCTVPKNNLSDGV